MAVSADGKKSQMLGKNIAAQNAGDVLWIARDGSPHILLALQTSIYSNEAGFAPEVRDFDVSTGKSTRVVPSTANVFDWYADGAGAVRLGIAYDDDRRSYRLLYRDKQSQSFRTVSKARGKGATLGNVPALFPSPAGQGRRPSTMTTASTRSTRSISRRSRPARSCSACPAMISTS